MNEIVGITTNGDRLSPLFDAARRILVMETVDGSVVNETVVDLPAEPIGEKIEVLARWGVTFLICGAISRTARMFLFGKGIRVLPFIAGPTKRIRSLYLESGVSALSPFMMPGNGMGYGPRAGWRAMGPGSPGRGRHGRRGSCEGGGKGKSGP